MSDVTKIYDTIFFGPQLTVTSSIRTHIRRFEYTASNSYPRARDAYHYITGRDNLSIHGLSLFNSGSTYLYDDNESKWTINQTDAYGSEGTPVNDFFLSGNR